MSVGSKPAYLQSAQLSNVRFQMAAARTIAFFDNLTDQQNPQDCIKMHDTIANWSTFLLSKSQQDEYRVL